MPNLIAGFGIDEVQAEYVAEIKLRNINREYILKRTKEVESLKKEIEELGICHSQGLWRDFLEVAVCCEEYLDRMLQHLTGRSSLGHIATKVPWLRSST